MKKIVHWGKYYPPDMGGIESVTASIAQGATSVGYAVTVVCFHIGRPSDEVLAGGVHVLRAPMLANLASQPIGWRYLWWCLREGRGAQLVHVHAPNMLAALAVALLGPKPKLVVHWHSDVVDKGWLGRMVAPVEALMLRRADRIVCTSRAYADASAPLLPFSGKIETVPIGVVDTGVPDFAAEHAPLPVSLEAKIEGRRLVLAIGRLVPYKGFHILVEAATQLPPDTVVLIVGTGPLHADLQARIDAAGVAGKVFLVGRQTDASLRALFKRADLFCLPSVERSEAFGVVLIEAMSYGVPVVTTQIIGSGVAWVNSDDVSGINVPVGDAQALAAACSEILASGELRARLSKGARERFEREFTETVSVERMLKVYNKLLQSPIQD